MAETVEAIMGVGNTGHTSKKPPTPYTKAPPVHYPTLTPSTHRPYIIPAWNNPVVPGPNFLRLGKDKAEIAGALAAAKLTSHLLLTQEFPPTSAHYFLDNQAVVSGLLKNIPDRPQRQFLAFRDQVRQAARTGCKTYISWVPGTKTSTEMTEPTPSLRKAPSSPHLLPPEEG
ncbi:hypothetical protein V8C42DRAFT_349273 [Trichoderma barbatum]